MNNDYIKFHTLGIMAHSKKPYDKTTYKLPPIDTWTEEFCETINQINYDENIKFSISSKDKLKRNEDKETQKIFESFPHIAKVENIYTFNSLPDNINYVRFTDCVILREEKPEFATQCANSIMAGLSLLQTFNAKRDEILKDKTESLKNDKKEAEKQCNLIQKICALQAHFTADNKRSIIGSDNYIFNELLQNANDRISDGIMNISIKGNELILSYNEEGFSAKDFLAISTSGNSGNIDDENRNNDNMNATGHKGTGFKSVYNVFEKVVIQSGFVKCTLDDSKKINCLFEGDEVNKVEYSEWDQEEQGKRYFPVPIFEFSDQCEEKTTIRLTFINKNKEDNFINQNKLDTVTNFEESKVYYFLDNIDKFNINGETFDKKEYLKDNFYEYEEKIVIKDGISLYSNPRWNGKAVDVFNSSSKSKITILFPKKNLPKQTLPEQTCIYCTLPVANEKLNTPFYINCPAFELEDGRNSISNTDNIKKWNECIWENAIKCSESVFSKIFKKFAEEHPDSAYEYFPYYYIHEWQCLKEISFIRTITGNTDSIKLMAWNQWYRELPNNHQKASEEEYKKGFVFLPDYMYKWFKEKNSLDEFSCAVPFVYYDDEFDYNNFRNEKLYETEEVEKISMKLFQNDDENVGKILLDIIDFFKRKYYVGREKVIQETFEIEFLKVLHETPYFNLQKQFCYQWYLGKTICESPAHCLNLDGIPIENYNDISIYKKYINDNFKSINEENLKECFNKLRTKLYFDYEDKIANEKDIFLNAVLLKFNENLDKIHQYTEELENVDVKLEDNRNNLFKNGKIVVKRGDGSFCLSNNVNDLFTSSVIYDAEFILDKPEWAKEYVDNLDKRLIKSKFYEEREKSFFEQENMLEKYLNECSKNSDVIKAIDGYIKKCETIYSKEKYLFESICKRYNDSEPLELTWYKKYLEMIDIYNKQINIDENKIEFNSQIKFCFNDEKLYGIPKYIVDKFNDRVDQKDKEKRFKFLGENEELSLKEILEKKVSICNDKYKNNRRYCIGTKICDKNEHQDIIIVFGEESVGTMLRDLFNCKSYINPSVYNYMDCYLPNPLFKPDYDNCNDLNFNEIPEINYSDDKELKDILIQRFEFKFKLEDKWFCFKGYGGNDFESKCCPLCGGVMIAEASSLRIRYIQAIQGIHVPILICSSCDEAVKYTENVYFCDEEGKKYLSEDNSKSEDRLIELLKSNQKIRICFDMFSNEKKIFLLDMTLVHRIICLKKLEERKGSEWNA